MEDEIRVLVVEDDENVRIGVEQAVALPASQWTHSRRPPTRCITSRPARRS